MQFKIIVSIFLTLFFLNSSHSQSEEKALFIKQIDTIVEDLKFGYQYDQAMREYILYKTFDKSVIDSLETIENEKDRLNHIISNNFKSDLSKRIWDKFIHPADSLFTERFLEISNSVGYPSLKRIKKHYQGSLPSEFNPVLILIHSPRKYWNQIREMAQREKEKGNMGKCDYGYIMWHTSERKENKHLDESGIEYTANPAGRAVIVWPCTDE